MNNPIVSVKRLNGKAVIPHFAYAGDAGADLATVESIYLAPGERKVVGTGIAVAIPSGYVGLVCPRSGLAARTGLSIVNSPGVIDAGYRGEVKVCLINTDQSSPIELASGDLVAQMVVQPIGCISYQMVDSLPESDRGTGGYGSSGGVAAWDPAQTL